eukprot:Seg318.15 transcript_id=Seg318.15/GoldUCD/mRNA.D3Y31 product="DnaJ subfamily C member 2" protein_id=Seg318.15/GoldUCD/D3Y31
MLPEAEQDEKTVKYHLSSGLTSVGFEPVGRWFEISLRRQKQDRVTSICSETNEDEGENPNDDDDVEEELTRDDKIFMLGLESIHWKKQDHYRVLRIKDGYMATDEEVRKAYRKMVLAHHPDKKSHKSTKNVIPGLNEHEYFTCITKAYEVLSNVTSRRAYDSVHSSFDDEVPTQVKGDFFETFRLPFKRNARWSNKTPVPDLGDINSSEEEVDEFYTFWYDFQSWRDYSYQDEEDKDQADCREERRWMEKQNRRKRQQKKKEELARIRLLVDTAYSNDPRIKKIAEEKKQKKLQEKKAKEDAIKEKERLRLEAEEEEKRAKELAEQEAKEKAAKEKKERDKMKKMLTKEKKVLRQVVKENGYFAGSDVDLVQELEKLEKTLENLNLESLQEMREMSEKKDMKNLQTVYLQHVNTVQEQLKKAEEKVKAEKAKQAVAQQNSVLQTANKPWSEDEMQLLVKASVLFPPGTASRWQVIANYINEHAAEPQNRTAKQIISKAKSLQKMDPGLKDEVNKRAFEKLKKETSSKVVAQPTGGVSVRDEGKQSAENPWSSEEQKLLEQALKTFPASTPERWDRIAEAVSTRSRKECMKRYKELVEMVKAKKSAQAMAAQVTKPQK